MGEIEIGELIVEWDDDKAEINRQKFSLTITELKPTTIRTAIGVVLWAV